MSGGGFPAVSSVIHQAQPRCLDVSTACISAPNTRRFAVLGAGFAGMSVAWHLLQHTCSSGPVCVEVYDEAGIGGGASGVSGGLLHPYSPKGKLLWKGAEGWTAALKLLAVAETANARASAQHLTEPIAWRRGILRPALVHKHKTEYKRVQNADDGAREAGIISMEGKAARALVPGLVLPDDGLALFMPHGLNLHPQHYLQALWMACQSFASDASSSGSPGTRALLLNQHIASLSELSGMYEAVVVCMGAKATTLPELAGKLPLSMCRGIVAHLNLPEPFEEYGAEAPSLLSSTWLAVQGPRRLVLGATKQWGCDDTGVQISADEACAVHDELLPKAAAFYPPITQWQVSSLHAGVRAMPPRTTLGALPLAGCIDSLKLPLKSDTHWWLLGGLGSRGLIYHAWLGEILAQAIVSQADGVIPPELNQFASLQPC